MTETPGDLREVAENARQRMSEMHERLSFIDARPGEVLMGRDRSGTVCIGVDLRGDVVKVELSADWREAVGPHSLPSAVVEAQTSAD